jgi:hypothetical protein
LHINLLPTFVLASLQFHPHAHCPLVSTEGNDADLVCDDRGIEFVLYDAVRVGVAGQDARAGRGDVADIVAGWEI